MPDLLHALAGITAGTFRRGGIHPPENKLTEDKMITPAPIPEQVWIPLSQHIGAPAEPIVAKGDQVLVGQVIAQAKGFVSAPIHAPVSGKIARIDEVVTLSGYPQPAILIKTDGDSWIETADRSDVLAAAIRLSREDIIARIGEAGIVGLGGAAFPTSVKYTLPPERLSIP